VFTRAELKHRGLAREVDALSITDEVYEHIVYAPHPPHLLRALPGMDRRTISCGSLSRHIESRAAVWATSLLRGGDKRVRARYTTLTVGAAAPLQRRPCRFEPADRYYDELLAATPPSAISSSVFCGRPDAFLRARGRVLRDGGHRRVQGGLTTGFLRLAVEDVVWRPSLVPVSSRSGGAGFASISPSGPKTLEAGSQVWPRACAGVRLRARHSSSLV